MGTTTAKDAATRKAYARCAGREFWIRGDTSKPSVEDPDERSK